MTILAAELKLFKSELNSDTPASNGGRMSINEIVSGISANLFSRAGTAERAAGSTKFRKSYWKVENDVDDTLANPRVYEENFSPGNDRMVFHAGTQTDTQDLLTGSEDLFGSGQLDASVLSGVTTIDVAVEAGADTIFRNGMLCRISNKTSIADVANNEDFFTINAAPGLIGDIFTLVFTPALSVGYTNTNTRVAGIYEPADIKTSFSGFTVTSASGLYDEITNPVEGDNIATVEQLWTLTFTSATAFDIAGDTKGAVGSGNISSDTQPNNPDFTKPYFILRSAGFSGTFATSDVISFTTSPASVPIWQKRIIPAGTASLSSNNAILVLDGESVTP